MSSFDNRILIHELQHLDYLGSLIIHAMQEVKLSCENKARKNAFNNDEQLGVELC